SCLRQCGEGWRCASWCSVGAGRCALASPQRCCLVTKERGGGRGSMGPGGCSVEAERKRRPSLLGCYGVGGPCAEGRRFYIALFPPRATLPAPTTKSRARHA